MVALYLHVRTLRSVFSIYDSYLIFEIYVGEPQRVRGETAPTEGNPP